MIRIGMLTMAVAQLIATAYTRAASSDGSTTTVYVGQHFEVRDHDQAVKYVFNGQTRVARITGSLSTNARVQRLRLRAGWNLCGIAVEGAGFPGNPEIAAAYAWNPTTREYTAVSANQPLNAGGVLWIKAATNVVASIVGTYAEPGPVTLSASGTYVSGAGLEAWRLQLPAGVTVWRFDGASKQWQPTFGGVLAPAASDLPPKLAPGEAIYVHTDVPVELAIPAPALRVAYYHQDHLGSSSAVTDAAGALIEEAAYYPFGAIRHEERLREAESYYQFTQKERDRESGLQDFGRRYYHAGIGKWISPDPLGERGGGSNPYAYVNQNPLKHYDPDGAQIEVKVNDVKKPTHYEIRVKAVFLDVSSKKFTQQQKIEMAKQLKSTIENSFKREKGAVTWTTKVDLRVVNDWSEVKKDDHVFRVVDQLGSAGKTKQGGMLMDIVARRYTQLKPEEVDQTDPANKHYTRENYTSAEGTATHEFGHAAGLPHDDLRENLMQNGSIRRNDNKQIHEDQIHTIWKEYQGNRLNKRYDMDKYIPKPSK